MLFEQTNFVCCSFGDHPRGWRASYCCSSRLQCLLWLLVNRGAWMYSWVLIWRGFKLVKSQRRWLGHLVGFESILIRSNWYAQLAATIGFLHLQNLSVSTSNALVLDRQRTWSEQLGQHFPALYNSHERPFTPQTFAPVSTLSISCLNMPRTTAGSMRWNCSRA